MFCPVDGTGRRPAAIKFAHSPPDPAGARTKETILNFSAQFYLSRNMIPSRHTFPALRVAFVILLQICPHRDSVKLPPRPSRTPGDRKAAAPHGFRRCPSVCAQASGLLRLTPPRAMRCQPALCGMTRLSSSPGPASFPPPPWGLRLLTSYITTATLPPPQHAHEFSARLASSAHKRAPPASTLRIFTGFRLSVTARRSTGPALVLTHSAAARVPASADLAVADLHAAGRPTGSVNTERYPEQFWSIIMRGITSFHVGFNIICNNF